MRPYELLGALWRRRLLGLTILVLVLGATLLASSWVPRSYTAVSVVDAAAADGRESADAAALRTTVADLVGSRPVAEAVSDDLARTAAVDRSPADLRDAVTATVSGTSIRVQVRDADPEIAALVARETVTALQLDLPESDGLAFTVTREAVVPTSYSRPGRRPVVATGLGLAVVLAVLVAVVADRRRRTVDDAGEAEVAAGAPLLAHVWALDDPTDLPALHPGTVGSDGFRHLRRSLEGPGRDGPADVVVVAGLGGEETHVWVGANLAIDLAGEGHEVLLVDGRLAGPLEGPAATDGPDTLGLSDVLAGAPLDDALSPGPVRGLSVLPAGPGAQADGDALLDAVFASVMEQARTRFDVVVVLPPPLQSSDEARAMASGGTMLLTLPERTVSAATLRRHAEQARATGTRLLGVVLVGHRGSGAK